MVSLKTSSVGDLNIFPRQNATIVVVMRHTQIINMSIVNTTCNICKNLQWNMSPRTLKVEIIPTSWNIRVRWLLQVFDIINIPGKSTPTFRVLHDCGNVP